MRTALLLAALLAAAPASAQLQLTRVVIGGGAVDASGGTYSLRGTIGQPAVGTVSGGTFDLCQGFWCGTGSVDLELTLTVLLQGAYDAAGDTMRTTLADGGNVPTAQPYDGAAFAGTPLAYTGSEAVSSLPAGAVDWILVELRSTAAPADSVTTAAALVLQDGTASVAFPGLSAGSYFVVARHRNHIPAISAAAVSVTGAGSTLDLTAAGAAEGSAGVVEVEPGVWALWAADGSGDGLVTAPDFNVFSTASGAGATGYQTADYTLDGLVTAPDFNAYGANASAGAASAVVEN
ncbi:MAG: hypothetical protein AAF594_02290 [Bacteroidota bacterium]